MVISWAFFMVHGLLAFGLTGVALSSFRSGHGTVAHMQAVFYALRMSSVAHTALVALLFVVAFAYMRESGGTA